jgi:type II secretory ATPase GspE/PulE/Tfp pilus assembly ATPase PilB-like protein
LEPIGQERATVSASAPVLDDTRRERISAGAGLADLRALSQLHGYKSLRADGLEKAHAGTTTPEEVFRVTA